MWPWPLKTPWVPRSVSCSPCSQRAAMNWRRGTLEQGAARRGAGHGSSAGRVAGETARRMSATSAGAALVLALSACAGDGGDEVSLPPPSDPDEIRQLNAGEFFLAARPATCKRTLAVLIVAGKPTPRERRLEQGDCFAWAHPASTISTVVGPTRRARRALRLGPSDLDLRLPPRFVSTMRGPLDALHPARHSGRPGLRGGPLRTTPRARF